VIVCDWCETEQDALRGEEIIVVNAPERDKGREYAALCSICIRKLAEDVSEEIAKREAEGGE